jgi:hypothetical protein
MSDAERAPSIALEEVTNAAFNGVLRALEVRKLPLEKFPGPIIVGIVAWPDMQNLQQFRQVNEPSG